MEKVQLLLEDYQNRLKTVTKELKKEEVKAKIDVDVDKRNRLSTKASCYRTFISEIERALNDTLLKYKK